MSHDIYCRDDYLCTLSPLWSGWWRWNTPHTEMETWFWLNFRLLRNDNISMSVHSLLRYSLWNFVCNKNTLTLTTAFIYSFSPVLEWVNLSSCWIFLVIILKSQCSQYDVMHSIQSTLLWGKRNLRDTEASRYTCGYQGTLLWNCVVHH